MREAARPYKGSAQKSSLLIRVIHALVFLGFASASMAMGEGEFRQLLFAWTRRFHFGDPPAPTPIIAALLGAAGALVLLLYFVRGKSVPLWASALPLLGLLLGYYARPEEPGRRTHFAANLDVLAAGRQLHRAQTDQLQTTAELSTAHSDWASALAALQLPASPVRNRTFRQLPFNVVMMKERGAVPQGLAPGTLAVWVSTDGVEFEIHPVGFDERLQPSALRDPDGKPIVLTGAYNPGLKAAPTGGQVKVAPSP